MGAKEDSHEHRVAFALREALPTRRHGEMLFDMVAEQIGPAARIEASPDGNHKVLYRLDGTDPRWVIPWPLLTLDRNPRRTFHMEIPGLKPAPPLAPRPGKAPNLRGLGPGYIQIQDGARYVQVAYAEDGRWFETSRGGPPSTLEGVIPLLVAASGPAVELVAEFVAAIDVTRNGPLRVFLPRPETWCAWDAWRSGLSFLRLADFRGALPPDARWVATDPVDGTALAWGATRDEALFAWSAEVERVRPGSIRPPPPEPPAFEPPGEPELPAPPDEKGRKGPLRINLSIGGPDPMLPRPPAPPPPPPEILPAVLIPLDASPSGPAPIGTWRRFLGGCGATVLAAYREDPAGWTLIGAPVLAALGAPDAEAALDEGDRTHETRMRDNNQKANPATPKTAWTIRLYPLLDESTGSPIPPDTKNALLQPDRNVPVFDGDFLVCGAARLRRTKS
jgi:hypothetical protein